MSETHQVAIVGLAGRFPGADNPDQLWLNLRDGVESIVFPSDAELLAAGVPAWLLADPAYVRAVACAPDVENFDAQFFGYTPKDARTCDPQIRMFLETAHAALENAGYDPYSCPGSVGVYGTTGTNRYMDLHLGCAEDASGTAGFAFSVLNYTDYLASTVSYKLGLRGPAITLATACSSSLVAVHLACQALRNGECDSAVAGGSEVELPLGHGYLWREGDPMSRDGHVRPFDLRASGTVFGTGVGVVVLKRLADALADHDTVLAVIRGSAINNDGSDKAGFSAPSITGQALMLTEAMTMADVSPADVSYIECHATATQLGDPIEIAALDRAYRALQPRGTAEPCLIGSVKGNIGHLGHAAGVVSLIKVVLSLRHAQIPATVNFTEPNPKLQLGRTPFRVAGELRPWPRTAGGSRCAGVSAFGIGGTNAHVIVEEGPRQPLPLAESRPRIVVWSAKSDQAERAYRDRLRLHLKSQRDELFAPAVSTLQDGRRAYSIRRALVAASARESAAALGSGLDVIEGSADCREIAFMFPGQGSQRTGMGAGLCRADPVFREALDEVFGLFEAHGTALRADWLNGADDRIADTRVAQPLLFSVEYALARMLSAWGIQPGALLGHSLGELTAAAVAGVFALPDAVALVRARAAAMGCAPAGGMLAIELQAEDLETRLPPELSVAVVNGPNQTVVAGPVSGIEAFQRVLAGQRIRCRRLRTSGAFHSPLMATASTELESALDGVHCGSPSIPLYLATQGRAVTGGEASSHGYWATQVAAPVRFDRALDALLAGSGRIVLEVGPGDALSVIARSHPAGGSSAFVPVLPYATGDVDDELSQALRAAGRVWADGHDLHWQAVRGCETVRRVPLPGYQYQRSRCWAELRSAAGPPHDPAPVSGPSARTPSVAGQFSIVCWREEPPAPHGQPPPEADCLLLAPADPAACLPVVVSVQRAGLRPVIVQPGPRYGQAAGGFTVRPGNAADLSRVLAAIAEQGIRPPLLVHALAAAPAEPVTLANVDAQLGQSLYSLLALLQAGAQHAAGGHQPAVLVITSGSADVTGAEPVNPAKAALHGFARSVIRDAPHLACRLIDITAPDEAELAAEITQWQQHAVVAIRGSRRWTPCHAPFEASQPGAEPARVIRRRGAYLLTGGLGGFGMAVARGLADTGMQPQLALLSRRGLPAEATDDRSARLRDQIAEMEAFGARVLVIACDVADRRALRRALDEATIAFGPLHGVVHMAGNGGDGVLAWQTAPQAGKALARGVREILAAKVHGTLALAQALAGRPPLDFFVCFSGGAATDGEPGDAGQAAAAAFQDAYALGLRGTGVPALTIRTAAGYGHHGEEQRIEPRHAVRTLCTLLRSRHPGQVLVEHGQSGEPASPRPADEPALASNGGPPGVTAAGGNFEERMTALWAEVIGDPQIDPDADFFELGGSSLTAVSLLAGITREFGIEVPVAKLFGHPTIRSLTQVLRAQGAAPASS